MRHTVWNSMRSVIGLCLVLLIGACKVQAQQLLTELWSWTSIEYYWPFASVLRADSNNLRMYEAIQGSVLHYTVDQGILTPTTKQRILAMPQYYSPIHDSWLTPMSNGLCESTASDYYAPANFSCENYFNDVHAAILDNSGYVTSNPFQQCTMYDKNHNIKAVITYPEDAYGTFVGIVAPSMDTMFTIREINSRIFIDTIIDGKYRASLITNVSHSPSMKCMYHAASKSIILSNSVIWVYRDNSTTPLIAYAPEGIGNFAIHPDGNMIAMINPLNMYWFDLVQQQIVFVADADSLYRSIYSTTWSKDSVTLLSLAHNSSSDVYRLLETNVETRQTTVRHTFPHAVHPCEINSSNRTIIARELLRPDLFRYVVYDLDSPSHPLRSSTYFTGRPNDGSIPSFSSDNSIIVENLTGYAPAKVIAADSTMIYSMEVQYYRTPPVQSRVSIMNSSIPQHADMKELVVYDVRTKQPCKIFMQSIDDACDNIIPDSRYAVKIHNPQYAEIQEALVLTYARVNEASERFPNVPVYAPSDRQTYSGSRIVRFNDELIVLDVFYHQYTLSAIDLTTGTKRHLTTLGTPDQPSFRAYLSTAISPDGNCIAITYGNHIVIYDVLRAIVVNQILPYVVTNVQWPSDNLTFTIYDQQGTLHAYKLNPAAFPKNNIRLWNAQASSNVIDISFTTREPHTIGLFTTEGIQVASLDYDGSQPSLRIQLQASTQPLMIRGNSKDGISSQLVVP